MTVGLGDRLQWTTPHQHGSHFTIAAITDTTAAIRYSNGQIEQLDPDQSYFFQDARILTAKDAPPTDLKQLTPNLSHLEHQLQQLQQSLNSLTQTNQREFAQLRDLIQQKSLRSTPQLPSAKTVKQLLQQQEKRLQERLQQIQRQSPLI